jgi:DNA-directed RNA polymerase sigma subunit (sigma70/sigma32)
MSSLIFGECDMPRSINTPSKIDYGKLNSQLFSEYRSASTKKRKEFIEAKLIKLNIKIVHDVVHKWNKRLLPFSEAELFTFGMLGLWVAIKNYDLTKGFQFSTFATRHVNGRILRAIRDEGSLIKIPQKVQSNHKITHKYFSFSPIDSEENPIQLEYEYKTTAFNERIEKMLEVANKVSIKGGNLRQSFTDCYNKLIDEGCINARKDNSKSVVNDSIETLQLSFLT